MSTLNISTKTYIVLFCTYVSKVYNIIENMSKTLPQLLHMKKTQNQQLCNCCLSSIQEQWMHLHKHAEIGMLGIIICASSTENHCCINCLENKIREYECMEESYTSCSPSILCIFAKNPIVSNSGRKYDCNTLNRYFCMYMNDIYYYSVRKLLYFLR